MSQFVYDGRGMLRTDGRLNSSLWVDQPDALQILKKKLEAEQITEKEADLLNHFIQKGYMIFNTGLTEDFLKSFDGAVKLLYEWRPDDVRMADPRVNGGQLTRMSMIANDFKRAPGTRLTDMHSHNMAARMLYLHPGIHRMVRLVLERQPIATQSLYFEFGSQQSPHRDPWFVFSDPPWDLMAAWIALEDIHEEAGPLVYYPGSHSLPYYRFPHGGLQHHLPGKDSVSREEANKSYAFNNHEMAKQQIRPLHFNARKGDVLIWHSSLTHGGGAVKNPNRTRKSFVVHFDALTNPSAFRRTEKVMTYRDCIGLDNPFCWDRFHWKRATGKQ
jgi:ectoine hydroxylase-related dioxygenase (phytanoyl-CoA dioxygenase family)